MSEENNGNIPEADRYSAEHVDTSVSLDVALREKHNARPHYQSRAAGVDLEGFILGEKCYESG